MGVTLACLDVDYQGDDAMAACLLCNGWAAPGPTHALIAHVRDVAPYEPGLFYKRELPCLLAVLTKVPEPPAVIVIDGYVWLGQERRPGLGAHLYDALDRATPVIGVAKTAFVDTPAATAVRGASARPLWVTAAGCDVTDAARHVQDMHGVFRIPSLLRQVDQLCRRSWPVGPSALPSLLGAENGTLQTRRDRSGLAHPVGEFDPTVGK